MFNFIFLFFLYVPIKTYIISLIFYFVFVLAFILTKFYGIKIQFCASLPFCHLKKCVLKMSTVFITRDAEPEAKLKSEENYFSEVEAEFMESAAKGKEDALILFVVSRCSSWFMYRCSSLYDISIDGLSVE